MHRIPCRSNGITWLAKVIFQPKLLAYNQLKGGYSAKDQVASHSVPFEFVDRGLAILHGSWTGVQKVYLMSSGFGLALQVIKGSNRLDKKENIFSRCRRRIASLTTMRALLLCFVKLSSLVHCWESSSKMVVAPCRSLIVAILLHNHPLQGPVAANLLGSPDASKVSFTRSIFYTFKLAVLVSTNSIRSFTFSKVFLV